LLYGTGSPAQWRHENLSNKVRDRVRREFASVLMSLLRQMAIRSKT